MTSELQPSASAAPTPIPHGPGRETGPSLSYQPVRPYRLVLTGGGTAGHVWPHFALFDSRESQLAEAYRRGLVEVHYFGSAQGMERELVRNHASGWRYWSISTGKLRRYFSWRNFTDPLRVIAGFFQAWWRLGKIKPDALFSKGGFVSAPVVWAAWLRGVPVVIHESDATAALATLLTVPFSYRMFTSFAETVDDVPAPWRDRVLTSGLPLRESLFGAEREAGVRHFELQPRLPTCLVFGGSLGAEKLNLKVFDALERLLPHCNVVHIVGKGKGRELQLPQETQAQTQARGVYRQFEFLTSEMALAYAAADVAVCRAGASSIFELAAARIPMLLVPLGLDQSRGDQILNARIFASRGWAEVVEESALGPELLEAKLCSLIANRGVLRKELSRAPGPDSAARVGNFLLSLMQRQHRS